MKRKINLDNIKRNLFKKYEFKRTFLKTCASNLYINNSIRWFLLTKLNNIPRNSSITRIRNRCVLTGRSRAIIRKFKISRLMFKELAGNGKLSGVQKSIW